MKKLICFGISFDNKGSQILNLNKIMKYKFPLMKNNILKEDLKESYSIFKKRSFSYTKI